MNVMCKELAVKDESGLLCGMEDMMALSCTNRRDVTAVRLWWTKWKTLMSSLGSPWNIKSEQSDATKMHLIHKQIDGSKLLERELVRYELEEELPGGVKCKSLDC